MLSVAFGGNISGTAIMTAAISNILTVELLYQFTNIKITYVQWFLYTFPLWLILIPAIWLLLIKGIPITDKKNNLFQWLKIEMEKKIEELGPCQ